MATTTKTEPVQTTTSDQLILRLGQPSEVRQHHVAWTIDTVDNEHMGKKKSKCCCIYKKPKNWQESSSENDSDCETGHCRGHVERRLRSE